MSRTVYARQAKKYTGASAFTIGLLLMLGAAAVVVFIIALWAALLGGIIWGIWSLVTVGPTLWNIGAIVVCGLIVFADVLRRSRR